MNPVDFVFLFFSLLLACASIFANGWTANGLGPAILLAAGGGWQFWMQRLRHRSWLRHRDSGFAPGRQHLALSAALGWFLCMGGVAVWQGIILLLKKA